MIINIILTTSEIESLQDKHDIIYLNKENTMTILASEPNLMLIYVPLISLVGVIFSSVFGYLSAYSGSKRSAENESKKLKETHRVRIEQENKFEKDRILRVALQDLTSGFYIDTFNSETIASFFNTNEGKKLLGEIMSKVTAYGSEDSVHTIIYLQKAVAGSLLLEDKQDEILALSGNQIPFSVDWERYEINALCAIMIAQLRYDISGEIINPKELLSVKFNNQKQNFKIFFEAGIDEFLRLNELDHFNEKEKTLENNNL